MSGTPFRRSRQVIGCVTLGSLSLSDSLMTLPYFVKQRSPVSGAGGLGVGVSEPVRSGDHAAPQNTRRSASCKILGSYVPVIWPSVPEATEVAAGGLNSV